MSCRHSDSLIYITKSVTWNIKSQSSNWFYSSPTFYLNNQDCIMTVTISVSSYNIKSVELKFTKSYYYGAKFIVILKFANELSEYIFNLLPDESDNNKFRSNFSHTDTVRGLGNANCSVSAEIFYRKLEYFKTSTFLDDMKCMLNSEVHSDFKIKAGDVIFNVHKAVITTRNDVLKTMLENDMLEKKSSQIELHADPVVVQALLEYLYTNMCKVSAAPTELFKLAHFLDIKELQIYCKYYLLSNIHLKNINSILELTSYNDYNLKDLYDAAMKFVNENENTLIADSEFQQFLCNNLKLETITYALKFSYKHQLDICLNKAMEFIRINYEKVLKYSEFQKYLESQPELNLKILKYCLDFFKVDANKEV